MAADDSITVQGRPPKMSYSRSHVSWPVHSLALRFTAHKADSTSQSEDIALQMFEKECSITK